jgi:hypothetical protein
MRTAGLVRAGPVSLDVFGSGSYLGHARHSENGGRAKVGDVLPSHRA